MSILDGPKDQHFRLAQLAAYHYLSAERGVVKKAIASRLKRDCEREGIMFSDGAYIIAIEAIDAYEDVRETYE